MRKVIRSEKTLMSYSGKIFCMSDTHTGGRAQPNHWCVCKVIFEKVSVILTEPIVNIYYEQSMKVVA